MADESMSGSPSGSNADIWARATAPQSPYTSRQITIGLIVLAIGLIFVFGIPLILT